MLTYKKTKLLVPQITHLSKLALDVRGKGFGWFIFRAFKSYFHCS